MSRIISSWYSLSISKRLSLWYGLTMMILLSLFAVFCYANFHFSIHRDFDRHLNHEKRELLPYVRLASDNPNFENLDQLRSVAYSSDGIYGTFVRLFSVEGDELYSSPNLQNHSTLPPLLPTKVSETVISREWEGKPMRTSYTPLLDDDVLKGWLEVSGFEWSLHQELYRLGQILVLGILLSLLLAVVGGYLLARRVLQPVASLTAAADQIQAHDLGSRLPTNFRVKDELTHLAVTFNKMLDRLSNSFQRERRFTSNAAHELLTPLTTIYNNAEIALRKERKIDSYKETIKSIIIDIEEMTKMVQGLLQLSQAERLNGASTDRADLREITIEHIVKYRKVAAAKNIELEAEGLDHAIIQGEAAGVGMILDNLIENAIKYTPRGGCVTIQIQNQRESTLLTVTDNGAGFNEDQAEHLFDRFYRADQAEIQKESGSGLGLSIVQAIVHNLNGTLRASSKGLNKGSTFEIRLPNVL